MSHVPQEYVDAFTPIRREEPLDVGQSAALEDARDDGALVCIEVDRAGVGVPEEPVEPARQAAHDQNGSTTAIRAASPSEVSGVISGVAVPMHSTNPQGNSAGSPPCDQSPQNDA